MEPQPPPKPPGPADTMRSIGALSTVGISFVVAILIGVGAGVVLDRWLGTRPWFFFIFFVLGVAAGILNVYRAAGRFLNK